MLAMELPERTIITPEQIGDIRKAQLWNCDWCNNSGRDWRLANGDCICDGCKELALEAGTVTLDFVEYDGMRATFHQPLTVTFVVILAPPDYRWPRLVVEDTAAAEAFGIISDPEGIYGILDPYGDKDCSRSALLVDLASTIIESYVQFGQVANDPDVSKSDREDARKRCRDWLAYASFSALRDHAEQMHS